MIMAKDAGHSNVGGSGNGSRGMSGTAAAPKRRKRRRHCRTN
ncbi:hypothetical protein [Azospirillum canadense]|nr:hypothetical protein [Azospirillum canadense]MCW2241795.1 hypothetical protein [Azospirillum canadense]